MTLEDKIIIVKLYNRFTENGRMKHDEAKSRIIDEFWREIDSNELSYNEISHYVDQFK